MKIASQTCAYLCMVVDIAKSTDPATSAAGSASDDVTGGSLFRGLFLVQVSADRQSIIGIDGGIAFFDVLHDTVFVDHDVGALGPFVGVALNVVAFQNAVSSKHLFVHVTEQRKF